MKLKDLKDIFDIEKGNNNQYYLFNPIIGSGKNLNKQFICVIEKAGNGFKIVPSEHIKNPMEIITDVYTHINIFKLAVERYVESLPYHSDFYYPRNLSYVFPMLVVNYFLKNLGFETTGNDSYILNQKNIYGGLSNGIEIYINGLDFDTYEECEKITINLYTSKNSYISVSSKKDADSIVLALNSLLKPLFLTNSIQNIELSDKLNFEDIELSLNSINLTKLSLKSESYKEKLKIKLEEILEKLK